jgi:hypothetical protein
MKTWKYRRAENISGLYLFLNRDDRIIPAAVRATDIMKIR